MTFWRRSLLLKDKVSPFHVKEKNPRRIGEKNTQWSNLSLLKVQELHIKIQSSSSNYSRDGWPQRPSSTQAILKIIKIKKNFKMKKITFLSFKYNFSCSLFSLSGSSIANLNSPDLPKNIYIYIYVKQNKREGIGGSVCKTKMKKKLLLTISFFCFFFYTNTVVNILKKSAFYLVNVTFAPYKILN